MLAENPHIDDIITPHNSEFGFSKKTMVQNKIWLVYFRKVGFEGFGVKWFLSSENEDVCYDVKKLIYTFWFGATKVWSLI